MGKLLMPKATAVWLVENTTLTFAQIARFCDLHELEIKGIADGDVAVGVLGFDPVQANQLTEAEIKRCEADSAADLHLVERDLPDVKIRSKGPRYTPITKRTEKPGAVAWLVKNHPGLSDAAIGRLLATTKDTIKSIRDRTHWNIVNIKPENPVLLGLCQQKDLEAELARVRPSRLAAAQAGMEPEAGSDDATEHAEAAAPEANPFAAALAAYASAARQKVQAEPTAENLFKTPADVEDETKDT